MPPEVCHDVVTVLSRHLSRVVTINNPRPDITRSHLLRLELRCPRASVRVWKLAGEETLQSLNTGVLSIVSDVHPDGRSSRHHSR